MELSSMLELHRPEVTAIGGLLLLLLIVIITHGQKRRRLPPGPRPWPILGNLALFGPLIHQDLKKLADKYGPLVYVRLGSVDAIAVSSPDIAEEILKTKDQNFASRPLTTQGRIISHNNSNVGRSPYGPYWRYARKVYTLELMTAKRIQQFQKDRKTEVTRALRYVLDECKGGKPIAIDHALWTMISSNVCRMAFGKTFGGDSSKSFTSDETQTYEKCVKEIFRLSMTFVPGDFIPLLRHFDIKGLKREMTDVAQRMDSFLDGIVEEHLQTMKQKRGHETKVANGVDQVPGDLEENDGKDDLVEVLLTRPAADHEHPLTVYQVKGLMQEVLAAGTDTSITTLSWALTELLRNPSTLKRAQAELDATVGRDRLVSEADVPSLTYMQAIVKEVFRLHPVAPLLVPHESFEASTLGKEAYYIPPKCRVFINTWAMGRDPALWESPLEFRPERFLDSDIDASGKSYKFLPFGSGRRTCPGRALAQTMVEYSLAAFLHGCNWALPDGMKPEDLDMTEAPGLTVPKAIPLETVASPRLPLSVIFDSS